MKAKQDVELTDIPKEQFIRSQKDTLIYKQLYSLFRRNKNKALAKNYPNTISHQLTRKIPFNNRSFPKEKDDKAFKNKKWLKNKKSIPKGILRRYEFVFRKINVLLSLTSLIRRDKDEFNVIYTSGFGYNNIGDEAQLNSNLKVWKELAPNANITLLSPNPNKTREIHGNYNILKASRNCFLGISGR